MENIFLRGFQLEDHILINKWRNDPEIQKLVSTSFKYVSLDIEKEWVRQKMMDNRKDIYLAICLNDESQQMIGYTSLNNIDYINRTVISGGIVIADKKYQDGILRFEVGLKMRELAFLHLNMNRLTAACIKEHFISRVTIEASGYAYEGCRRQAVFKNGTYHDQLCYSLLRDEYFNKLSEGYYTIRAYAKRIKNISERIKNEIN
ncbi:MAG: GNAT family N-acetyltransferase [Bacteroides sp.]|nr:GNAT family N-acetyltransferase [Bacteroides sp.]